VTSLTEISASNQERRAAARKAHPHIVTLLALLTFGSGLVNLSALFRPNLAERIQLLRVVFPVAFLTLSRLVTLAAGLGLVLASFNIYKRKRRAYITVVALAAASIVFHMTKGLDYEEATVSFVLLILLVSTRHHFTVKSARPTVKSAVGGVVGVTLLAMVYGTAGVLTVLSVAYAAWRLFRPVAYQQKSIAADRERATEIVHAHGRTSLDFHKTQSDKSLFFSASGQSFLAYRVAGAFAVVLGDPVGPDNDLAGALISFCELCTENDWGLALYQTAPHFLELYRLLGFKTLKLGDEAIVDLNKFSLRGSAAKNLRTAVAKLERLGLHVRWEEPPLSPDLIARLKKVADDWQQIPGRRERRFSVGRFDPEYLRSTPALLALDARDEVVGFVNVVPSHRTGEAAIDLMRRQRDAPNGVMDYLLVKLCERDRQQGFDRLSLGMAPMNGFRPSERASSEERAIHEFFQRLNFVFSFKGLRAYKAKFATDWEPRYVIYRTELDLARLVVAFARISETAG
jgi:phosphatidylglycerol lysyltransferase